MFGEEHKYTASEVYHRFRFKKYTIHNLYAYEHSGLMLGLNDWQYPFNCRWDAYQIGLLVTPAKMKIDRIQSYLDEYNQWLNGDTWGFIIYDEDDNEIDSTWNYYGYENAEEAMNCVLKELEESDE
jgi:hypothetical protein